MVGHSLLSRAGREVQVADHLLTVSYPLIEDPRLLLSVMRHCCIAGEIAMAAVSGVPGEDEAQVVLTRFRSILDRYGEAPTAFARKHSLVIASEGFSDIETLDRDTIVRGLGILKDFVYRAGKRAMLEGSP